MYNIVAFKNKFGKKIVVSSNAQEKAYVIEGDTFGERCINVDHYDFVSGIVADDYNVLFQFKKLVNKIIDKVRRNSLPNLMKNEFWQYLDSNNGVPRHVRNALLATYFHLLYGNKQSSHDRKKLDSWVSQNVKRGHMAVSRQYFHGLNWVLEDIAETIKDEGYKYSENANLLSQGFLYKRMNCFGFSSVYLSVAEVLGLPMAAVLKPNHIRVVWDVFGLINIHWETTTGNYIASPSSEYARPSSYKDPSVYAAYFNNRGCFCVEKSASAKYESDKIKYLNCALDNFENALILNPNCTDAENNAKLINNTIATFNYQRKRLLKPVEEYIA